MAVAVAAAAHVADFGMSDVRASFAVVLQIVADATFV